MDLERVLSAAGFKPGERFQVAAIKPGSGPACACGVVGLRDSDIIALTEKHSGRANIYLCANPLKADAEGRRKASLDDIAVERCLLIDADPEKTKDDPEGLSEASRAAARDLVLEARDYIHKITGHHFAAVDSGRGHQLWVILDPFVERRAFARGIAAKFQRPGVKVDATHDACRLMRFPGFVNLKTGRVAEFVA